MSDQPAQIDPELDAALWDLAAEMAEADEQLGRELTSGEFDQFLGNAVEMGQVPVHAYDLGNDEERVQAVASVLDDEQAAADTGLHPGLEDALTNIAQGAEDAAVGEEGR
ncbi:MAG: hypothetical protein ACRDLL_01375 [Solirubrobacterales bacterium]